ncbi:MAG: type II toxin-antitoxin system Phd/YefM family antitoxin [Polyangiales bacterium]
MIVTAKDLANHTGAVLERVRSGATVDISYRGRIVAHLVPQGAAEVQASSQPQRQALRRLRGVLRPHPDLRVAAYQERKHAEKALELPTKAR